MIDVELPAVAVVGRPNVGKSTLVNRILGRREAIVEERPGVTRDRKEYPAEWNGRRFRVIDTGGWEPRPGTPIAVAVAQQAEKAIAAAALVLFVVDSRTGVTGEDAGVVEILRRSPVPVIVVANKVDSEGFEPAASELWALGLGDVISVSALHGRGSGDLLDAVVKAVPRAPETTEDDDIAGPRRIALAGRPNVGKSTLFNRLVGEERSIVNDRAGTTRDSIDTVVELADGRSYVFVDTAGMRRRTAIDSPTEFYSVVRTLQAIDASDAGLLLIDASEGVTHQDQALAERIMAAGSAPVLILNKWDLADEERREATLEDVADRLWFCAWAPVARVSAKTGRNVHRLLPLVDEALAARARRVPTAALNVLVQRAQDEHAPKPAKGGRLPKIKYAVQGAVDPPTFTFFSTATLTQSYMRYLERRIRDEFALGPTPVKLRVRIK